jgi:hypothetical protein
MGREGKSKPVSAAAVAACLAGLLLLAPGARAAPACTRYAAPPPVGSAAGSGAKASPYGSAQQLINSLAPGEVGCLAADAVFNETINVANRPGTAQQPFVVQSEDPAHPATITGTPDADTLALVYVGTTASHFSLVGVNIHALPGSGQALTIAGTANGVVGADITNPTSGSCVLIGPAPDRRAADAYLEGDAIHGCGNPSGGHADGLGIGYANGTHVTDSYFYGSPRHGITMYPDAQHTTIDHNVIDRQHNGMGDGEGVQFGGNGSSASSDNLVEANVISDNETYNIGYNWNDGSGPVGTGNVVRGNCISNTANPSGEFQTAPPPTGYTEEQNTVGSDPQYVNRDQPPAGYALSTSSPCLRLGPLPSVRTNLVVPAAPDPEGASVFTAVLEGEINPHLQSAAFHFDFGASPNALTALPSQQVGGLGMPAAVTSESLTGLEPSATYSYRIVPDSPAGAQPGQVLTFTTAAAPLLAPPIPTISYKAHVTKKGVSLPNLALKKLPSGATVTLRCSSSPNCPFAERTGTGALAPLRQSVFGRGTKLYIEVDQPAPVGRYRGRATIVKIGRIKHGTAAVTRSEGCVLADDSLTPCLRPFATVFPYRKYALFNPLTAVGVAAGTTVDYKCVRGRCPRFPTCETVSGGFKNLTLLPRKQKVRAGVTFDVRFLKPGTQGLVTRFMIHRGRGKRGKTTTTQKNSFVPASVQHAGQCRDA